MKASWMAALLLSLIMISQSTAQQDALISSDQIVERLSGNFSRYRNLVPVTAPSINLTINFKVGAATLGAGGKRQLVELSKALGSESLRDKKVLVEGHTDAQGSPELNLRLSAQRAAAVVEFLVMNGIERDRLSSVGKGFTDLLDKQNPMSAKNRRVTIKLETP